MNALQTEFEQLFQSVREADADTMTEESVVEMTRRWNDLVDRVDENNPDIGLVMYLDTEQNTDAKIKLFHLNKIFRRRNRDIPKRKPMHIKRIVDIDNNEFYTIMKREIVL